MKYVLCNQKIHMRTRILFYNAFVRSRMTYACQTWTLTVAQIDKLNSAHTKLLRRMIRSGFKRRDGESEESPSLRYFYTSDDLFKITKTNPLKTFINSQRHKFASHLIRRPNSRHCKQLLFNDDKYKKSGRRIGTLLEQVVENSNVDRDQFIRDSRSGLKFRT